MTILPPCIGDDQVADELEAIVRFRLKHGEPLLTITENLHACVERALFYGQCVPGGPTAEELHLVAPTS